MNDGLQPIQLLPAREHVASVLRDAILDRNFKQGETLTLDALSKELKVSKTPVREAFQILERDGLIQLIPNKGAVVLGINRKTIIDSYELRIIMECAATQKICQNGAPLEAIEQAHRALEKITESGEYHAYPIANLQFHQAIWHASGNARLQSMMQQLCSGLNLGRGETSDARIHTVLEQHEDVLRALRARDATAAAAAMRKHIERSMNGVLLSMAESEKMTDVNE